MAASTTQSYHVNGPLLPQCNIGSANAYVVIGECQDGADISITPIKHEIKSDGGGGMDGGAVEKIILNAFAEIRMRLVPYAGVYVNKLRAMSMGSAVDGQLVLPGTLMGGSSMLPALYLPNGGGQDVDGPWWFPITDVIVPGNNRVWTKETTPEWIFRAFVYYDPGSYTSVSGKTLYTRTAPA